MIAMQFGLEPRSGKYGEFSMKILSVSLQKKIIKGADFVLEREQKLVCSVPDCLLLLIPDARPGRIWLFSLSCYHSAICQQILVQT